MSSAKKLAINNHFSLRLGIGIGLIILSLGLAFLLFRDALKQEITYTVLQHTKVAATTHPVNTDFSLVIDKIGATSAIIEGVDPYNSVAYQKALSHGVAHAKGTKLPGQGGNIFLFAHSSVDLFMAQQYNSVFYLIHHLDSGDIIKIWYQNQEYDYQVSEKKIVSQSDVDYLTKASPTEVLTLMTCWPPGTNLKRLIVIAKPL